MCKECIKRSPWQTVFWCLQSLNKMWAVVHLLFSALSSWFGLFPTALLNGLLHCLPNLVCNSTLYPPCLTNNKQGFIWKLTSSAKIWYPTEVAEIKMRAFRRSPKWSRSRGKKVRSKILNSPFLELHKWYIPHKKAEKNHFLDSKSNIWLFYWKLIKKNIFAIFNHKNLKKYFWIAIFYLLTTKKCSKCCRPNIFPFFPTNHLLFWFNK